MDGVEWGTWADKGWLDRRVKIFRGRSFNHASVDLLWKSFDDGFNDAESSKNV